MKAPSPVRPARLGGFTLIEILVALLILGIMTALGYETYRAARISAEHTEESLKRSREIEFGMRVMVMDFAQIVPRPVRDPLGQTRLPALHGFSGNGTSAGASGSGFGSGAPLGAGSTMHFNSGPRISIELFRFGHQHRRARGSDARRLVEYRGATTSTLQRVSYGLVNDVLKRSYQEWTPCRAPSRWCRICSAA